MTVEKIFKGMLVDGRFVSGELVNGVFTKSPKPAKQSKPSKTKQTDKETKALLAILADEMFAVERALFQKALKKANPTNSDGIMLEFVVKSPEMLANGDEQLELLMPAYKDKIAERLGKTSSKAPVVVKIAETVAEVAVVVNKPVVAEVPDVKSESAEEEEQDEATSQNIENRLGASPASAQPQITLQQIRLRTRETNLNAERYVLDRILYEEAYAKATHDSPPVAPQRLMKSLKNETPVMEKKRLAWEARMDALMPEYKRQVTDRVTANRAAKVEKKARRLATAQAAVDSMVMPVEGEGVVLVARHMRPDVIQRRALKSFLAEERRAERSAAMYARDANADESMDFNGHVEEYVEEEAKPHVEEVKVKKAKKSKTEPKTDTIVEEAPEVKEKKSKKVSKTDTIMDDAPVVKGKKSKRSADDPKKSSKKSKTE